MEIIHVVLGKANPERMNGVNKVVHELSTRQHQAGLSVQVWGITASPVHDYPERDYHTKLFTTHRYPFFLSEELKTEVRKMKGKAVFHLHGGFIPAMFRMAMLLRKNRIPFVFTPHGSYNVIAMKKSGIRKKIYFRLFERKLLAAAANIHSLGRSEVNGLQEIFPNNKTKLIPYGFELIRQEYNRSATSEEFIIGYCGRIDIYTKGLEELLLAFREFHQQYSNSRLWIIGNGGEMPTLLKIADSLQLDKAVVFFGAKFGQEKNELLSQCHVFAAPSRNEGLPTAVLEAAALGIPCMVTEATNTGDAIRRYDAGVVIKNTDHLEIRSALDTLYQKIISNHQLPVLAGNARQMISSEFNWSSVISRFNELYR